VNKLRDVRVARSMTQFDLGLLSGLGQSGIAKVETGDRKLGPEAKLRVIKALRLTAEEAWAVAELAVDPIDPDTAASMSRHPSRTEVELDAWERKVGT